MLRDRYNPLNLFELVPAFGVDLDPVLTQLDTLLDDDLLFKPSDVISSDAFRAQDAMGVPPPRLKSFSVCSSSSNSMGGATRRPSSLSAIVLFCANFAASTRSMRQMTIHPPLGRSHAINDAAATPRAHRGARTPSYGHTWPKAADR